MREMAHFNEWASRIEEVFDDEMRLVALRGEIRADEGLAAADRGLLLDRVGTYLADLARPSEEYTIDTVPDADDDGGDGVPA